MGRTFHRYLFRQILAPFAAGLALFTFILLSARIMKLVELVVNRGVPALEVLKVFSFILPAFLEVTVPMALLLACLMACGRLSSDSEFVAMRACGLSLYQFARPFAAFAVAVWSLVPDEKALSLDLRLHDGTIFTNADGEAEFHKTDFGSYDVSLNLVEALGQLDRKGKDPGEIPLDELSERIETLDAKGEPSREERVEWHRRFSLPFASLVFALLAIPLGLQPVRAVRSRGLALSLGIILLYYVMLSAAETLGAQGRAPIVLALWTPNIVMGLLGLALFRRAARERPWAIEPRLANLVEALRERALRLRTANP